ncbi:MULTISPECIES: class I SAM-dependent methyltransferase [unclassified Duganella]|uniref:class I SAM-dependent methyltransferase n=1 Tax=unclassified Duganella TaxID=2636909 RepID=UPI00088EB554|nr:MULTISPECIES: class I SAM-dependent methyltransferase [unclassified Duganella]SDF93456.1 Predicted methyltransferase regulatory domain-containing protein [Duganella sp. OV458]SDJ11393.1 Predicted methyltransferase regulatory domain-containing protein [Duganella sp. OV510]
MSNDWSSGYVADIGYTYGYYNELNPLRMQLAFLSAGLVAPQVGTACELGFGQGMSTNLHAAATVTRWYGTDFNPAQAGFAQDLANSTGTQAKMYDEAFAEFAQRGDLPDFDYIGLHGIWTWISDENRAIVVDFIRRKLKVGGVLYISYNTQPGWAQFAPVRHLLAEHAGVLGAEGQGAVARVEGALAFTDKLLATQPLFARANPHVADRFAKLKDQNRAYLAHEYFNRDWHPMYYANMAKWLEPAKLTFACSAHLLDHVETLNLTPEQQSFMAEIPDAGLRQTVRDFMVNMQFRRDYWVKGARRLTPLEQLEAIRLQRVILVAHRPSIPLTVKGALGEGNMSPQIYGPLLDLLSDYQPHTLHSLEQAMARHEVTFAVVLQAVVVLSGALHLEVAQDEAAVTRSKPQTDRVNAWLLNKSRSMVELSYLASPVTGGGVRVSRFQQLFILARQQGLQTPNEWAQFAWDLMRSQGQRAVKADKVLTTPEENLAELQSEATFFVEKGLPILQGLQIV